MNKRIASVAAAIAAPVVLLGSLALIADGEPSSAIAATPTPTASATRIEMPHVDVPDHLTPTQWDIILDTAKEHGMTEDDARDIAVVWGITATTSDSWEPEVCQNYRAMSKDVFQRFVIREMFEAYGVDKGSVTALITYSLALNLCEA